MTGPTNGSERETPARRLLARARRSGARLAAGGSAFRAAAALSAVWLGGALAYGAGFFGLFASVMLAPGPGSALEIALFALAALAPVALFFYGAFLAETASEIRAETARLSAAIEAREPGAAPARADAKAAPAAASSAGVADAAAAAVREALGGETRALAATLTRLDQAQARLDRALAENREIMARIEGRESAAERAAKITGPAPARDRAQPILPFGGDAEPQAAPEGIPWDSVVRAIDFPKDERDRKGFAAIRQVVADRSFAELLQAAEDTLSLLAADGLYMEDLTPEPATVDDWKRYADGVRGPDVGAVGGITDEAALETARARLRRDAVFRDTVLHFLRRFDRLIRRMTEELGPDPMILEAADSRTGRAFMIVARITGAFD